MVKDVLFDALVIGGGFYGCEIANYLVRERGFTSVAIVEQETELLTRASLRNQARVHGGYHYPRDFVTAHRSRLSRPRFLERYPASVFGDVTSLYAISRNRSHVRAETFSRRMRQAGAELRLPPAGIVNLFNQQNIEAVYEVDEQVFDAGALRKLVSEQLIRNRIRIDLGVRAVGLRREEGGVGVSVTREGGEAYELSARYVFNCTYSGLNTVDSNHSTVRSVLKHEIAELTILDVPKELVGLGITVMDGPFFSLLPYPPSGQYSLSHVRYTPQMSWIDKGSSNPYDILRATREDSRGHRMVKDAARFVPSVAKSKISGSFREVKTVLMENEQNDGRPILVEKSDVFPGLYSVLGGKIDNIFDIFEYLAQDNLELGVRR